jgi:hypothetical protein
MVQSDLRDTGAPLNVWCIGARGEDVEIAAISWLAVHSCVPLLERDLPYRKLHYYGEQQLERQGLYR